MESSSVYTGKVKASVNWLRNQPLGWLVAGQAVAAVAGLLYGKLTAIYVAPGELGNYNLLYAGMMLLYTLLIAPIIQSFKASLSRQSHSLVVKTHSGLLLRIYAAALLLLTLFTCLRGCSSLGYVIWLAAVSQGVYALGSDYLTIRGRYKVFAGMQMGYALVNLLLFLLLCVAIGWRTSGALWGAFVAVNLLFAAVAIQQLGLTATRDERRQLINVHQIKRADLRGIWQYALPLTTMAFLSWLINYADRYLIHYYRGNRDVGTYTMGYSLGSKLLLLATPVITYLTGVAIRQKANGESVETFQTRQIKYTIFYVGVAATICLIFYVYKRWLGSLFMSSQYEEAFSIGPLIAISYLFITTISFFEIKWYVYNKTRYILIHNGFGALANLSLNGCLISKYGHFGAAYAMIGSTFCQLCLVLCLYNLAEKE